MAEGAQVTENSFSKPSCLAPISVDQSSLKMSRFLPMQGDFVLDGGWTPWARMNTPALLTMPCRRGLNLPWVSTLPSSVLPCDNGSGTWGLGLAKGVQRERNDFCNRPRCTTALSVNP